MTSVNTQCRLAARPMGLPKAPDWAIVEEPIPDTADGEFIVEVDYLSIDPAMRTWMNAGRSYVPAVQIGEVMRTPGGGLEPADEFDHGEASLTCGSQHVNHRPV